jgi:ankyrin repeat protein
MDSLDSGFLDSGSWIGSGNIIESKKKKKNESVTEEELASLIGGSVIFVCVFLLVLLIKFLNAVCWMIKAVIRKIGLWGGLSKEKLFFVPDAGANPIEKREVTEAEIPLILLNSKTVIKQLKEQKAEIPEILKTLKEIEKESKITLVEIYQSSMGSVTNRIKAFHVFAVFRTSESDGRDYWWSLEKNLEGIVLQRSRNKDDVKNKLYGDERKKVGPYKKDLKGKGSIKDLLEILLKYRVIPEHYNIATSNCETFITLISERITEKDYKYISFIERLLAAYMPTIVTRLLVRIYSYFQFILPKRERNPKLNTRYHGYTLLHIAIMLKKTELVQHLLKYPINADPTICDSKNLRNALHMCAMCKAMKGEIFDLLLAHPQVKIDDVDLYGRTALHLAASASNVIAVGKLLEKGANPNIGDIEGLTPLHLAARRVARANPNVRDKWGLYPLHSAAYFGSETEIIDLIQVLIIQAQMKSMAEDAKRKTTENFSAFKFYYRTNVILSKWRSCAEFVLCVNNVNWVRCLIIEAYHTRDEDNMVASQNTDLNFLDLILANVKVDINDGGKFGLTVLHLAMATSNVTAARFLLSKGANPNVAGKNGATPLHVAAYCANTTDVLGLILVNKQVDINGRDHNGQTALHYAARNNNVKTALYLLGNGADPAIRDNNGNTLFHLEAAFNKNSAILDLLPANENKTEIDEGNNAKDLDIIELPLIQKDVINVNSLVNSGAQQDIQSEQSEGISNPLKGVTPEVIRNSSSGLQSTAN